MPKRTYFTKRDMMSFARHIVSDHRRGQKQREAREQMEQGVINFLPWSHAERIVTDQDFEDWKLREDKMTRDEIIWIRTEHETPTFSSDDSGRVLTKDQDGLIEILDHLPDPDGFYRFDTNVGDWKLVEGIIEFAYLPK
jgi:hypothetical protein